MATPCLLGLDIGTLGVKGVAVTTDGRVLARAHLAHSVSHPQRGWAEQDADDQWWGDGLKVIRDLLAADVDPAAIAAIGVSGLVPCLCLVDAAGLPLRPAILYSDNRALAQLAEINTALGLSLTAQAITPKWRWLAEHEQDVLRCAQHILSSHNYVVYRLTGAYTMDFDTASIAGGVFDTQRKVWDERACAAMGLGARLLPPVHAVTEVVGSVTDLAAAATGLRAGTPVIAGTGDTFPTLVGCGAVAAGDAMISLGTTGLLTLTTHRLQSAAAGPHFAAASADDTRSAGEEGAVLWAANVLACGQVLAWFREELAPGVHLPSGPSLVRLPDFPALDRAAAAISPGSHGLIALPHLMGRRTPTPDPAARGAFVGLTPSHTAADIYRSLLESVGYALRQGFDPIRSRVRRVIATAGGAASPLWRQILADILETSIEYHPAASGALGIAFIAGFATGYIAGFEVIRDAWLVQPAVMAPDPTTFGVYRALCQAYCYLDDTLGPVYRMLDDAI